MRLAIIIAVTLIGNSPIAQEVSHVIAPKQAGPVRIGDPADSVYSAFPTGRRSLVDLQLEGDLTPALKLTLPGSETKGGIIAELGIHENRLVVTRIRVVDPALKTAQGIGVGSSMTNLRSTYRIDWIGHGEGQLFARVESLGASFELDQSLVEDDLLFQLREPSQVPGHVRIVGILLT